MVCVHGHSLDVPVTVPSTDTRTWGGGTCIRCVSMDIPWTSQLLYHPWILVIKIIHRHLWMTWECLWQCWPYLERGEREGGKREGKRGERGRKEEGERGERGRKDRRELKAANLMVPSVGFIACNYTGTPLSRMFAHVQATCKHVFVHVGWPCLHVHVHLAQVQIPCS